MATLAELERELGMEPGSLTGKNPAITAKYDGMLTEAASAPQKLADAQAALKTAQDTQAVIDENIRNFGMTETTVAELRASNAALTAANASYVAAMEEINKQGFKFEGVNMPKPVTTTPPDPLKSLSDTFAQSQATLVQAIDVSNQYARIFGKPMPDTLNALAAEAAQRRLPINAYAEQKYGFSAEEKKQMDARTATREAEVAAAAVKKYQEEHPNVSGNPNLTPGGPSNYPALPPKMESNKVREFANMSPKQKMDIAFERASAFAQTRSAARN